MLKTAKEKLGQVFSQKDKKSRFHLMVGAGIIILVVILAVGIVRGNTSYDSYEVVSIIDNSDNVSVNYEVIGEGLLKYSRNGASYSNKAGKVLWNQAFEMSSVQVAGGGDYIAIGDIGANEIRIFNKSGQVKVVSVSYPISSLEVANQGIVAAILSDTQTNYINLYDTEGNELVSIKATISNTGYPVSISLSPNGQRLAVSYLFIEDGNVASKLIFYDFGNAGQSKEDRIMGSFTDTQLYPVLEFISDSEVVAYGESKFVIYTMGSSLSEVSEVTFDAEIKSMFSNSKYIGFVFKNSASGERSKAGKYRMLIYTTSGKLYQEKYFDFDYHSILSSKNEIILYNDYECVMYDYRGKQRFYHVFENQIKKLLPQSTDNRFILIDENEILDIRLK